ncbi:14706_t:CDS:2, partial [Cetraspora pellucida]
QYIFLDCENYLAYKGVIVPSQPQKPNSSLTLNSDLYILNTQDYTWINYFDASNIYGPNNSLSLGAKIGISIAVIVALVVIVITGFFIYKKFHVRNNYLATVLNWLINYNILYKNIKLDETILNSLSKNEISIALRATTIMVNINSEKIEHYTRYMTDSIDSNVNNDNYTENEFNKKEISDYNELYNPINSISKLKNLSITYLDNIPISEKTIY